RVLFRSQEVRVFRALRDALVGQELADVVVAQECAKLLLGDVGVDGHVGQAFPLTKAMSAAVSSTSRNTRLTGKFSVSSAVTASSTATSKRSRKALMISSTISSGAEAPADRPRTEMSPISPHGISSARCTSMLRLAPARSATSTRRLEFDEFGAPTTRKRSVPGAAYFTASCRFVVA